MNTALNLASDDDTPGISVCELSQKEADEIRDTDRRAAEPTKKVYEDGGYKYLRPDAPYYKQRTINGTEITVAWADLDFPGGYELFLEDTETENCLNIRVSAYPEAAKQIFNHAVNVAKRESDLEMIGKEVSEYKSEVLETLNKYKFRIIEVLDPLTVIKTIRYSDGSHKMVHRNGGISYSNATMPVHKEKTISGLKFILSYADRIDGYFVIIEPHNSNADARDEKYFQVSHNPKIATAAFNAAVDLAKRDSNLDKISELLSDFEENADSEN